MSEVQARRSGRRASGARSRMTAVLVKRVLCVALLLCAVIVSARTTAIMSTTLFDSDTSSELILGEKLSREGGIMSPTWYYSTELQVFDCHIVYALLFHLTSDWSLVRLWGALLMQWMMLGAFGFLARQARIPFNRFCVAGAAMLLPFSVPYGRIILFHNYYSFYMIMANLTVGLYLGAVRRMQAEGFWKRWAFWVFGGMMCLVSFAAGLGGVRELMVCTAPLLASALLCALVGERKLAEQGKNGLKAALPALGMAVLTFACSGLGYLVNLNVFSKIYHYTDYSSQYVALSGLGDLSNVLRDFLLSLGFHDQNELMELYGLLGIGTVLVWLAAVLLAFHTLRNTEDFHARFLSIFMLVTHLVMVFVFMLLVLDGFRGDLYFLPATFWIIPAMAKADLRPDSGMDPEEKRTGFPGRLLAGDAPVSVHGLTALLVLAIMIANGFYYTGFFRNPEEYKQVEYSGLNFGDTGNVKGMQPIADFLVENGYSMIYGSYWDAAVITELTDGKVKSVPVEPGRRKHPIQYSNWLSDGVLRDPAVVAEKKVAVVANFELGSNLGEDNPYGATEVFYDNGYTVYEFPDPAVLAKDLQD